jgi:cytidylate kinase
MIGIQIAIDGPAGSGKSTIARMLAKELGYIHIDTGAMYRAVTLLAQEKGLGCDNEWELTELAASMDFQLQRTPEGQQLVICNGRDVTEAIRKPAVSRQVSKIASLPKVRRELVKKQQALAENHDVVMDGRDIGLVVLPAAECKVFLTASPEERARRRQRELSAKGYQVDYETIRREVEERDWLDQHRAADPLRPAPGAVIIDSTALSLREVADEILLICAARKAESGGSAKEQRR